MTRILILTLAILAGAVLAKAAAAQDCEHVDAMHDRLLSVQGKRLAYSGLLRSGLAYVEIWLREDTVAEVMCFRSVARYVFDLLKGATMPGTEVGYWRG